MQPNAATFEITTAGLDVDKHIIRCDPHVSPTENRKLHTYRRLFRLPLSRCPPSTLNTFEQV